MVQRLMLVVFQLPMMLQPIVAHGFALVQFLQHTYGLTVRFMRVVDMGSRHQATTMSVLPLNRVAAAM
jgi:hypothetical protein